jgi:uncharacterized protein YceK
MRKLPIASIVIAIALAGCAGTVTRSTGEQAGMQYRDYAGEPIDKFTAFNFDSWTAVSRNQLVVWTGINEAYLLTVWDSCDNLQFAERIAVRRTGSSVTKFDSVQVKGQRCPISEIRRVDVKQMKMDRAALRAKP